MSNLQNECRGDAVLHEVNQEALHDGEQRRRNTVYNPYLKEYVSKRSKKYRYLQSVLATNPNKYDMEWYGDSM